MSNKKAIKEINKDLDALFEAVGKLNENSEFLYAKLEGDTCLKKTYSEEYVLALEREIELLSQELEAKTLNFFIN